MPTFDDVPERPDFPKEEEKTLVYWRETDAFQESLKQSEGKPPYNFYDGPPFATGLPHYGHILAGTIKDVVTRHAHQRGYHVERRFGWDCHGVPVEGIIDAKLNIKGRSDVLAMGIDKYNEECRSIVQKYTKEWRDIVERYGRWIDFDNDYKTMELSFMESIWWVFKQLWDKGMVYRSFRVIAYSTALQSSLSNFEANQNYQEVSDPSIIVKFKRKDKENAWILAWTTTPWTLPSNLGLCVHPKLMYLRVKAKADGEEWIVGKDRWAWICSSIKKDAEKDFTVEEELEGAKLVGIPYEPLFDYFKGKVDESKCWHIVSDEYVTTGAGTCIVHQAPAYGDDDNRVCKKFGIISFDCTGMVDPIDEGGKFKKEVHDFTGQHIKEADKGIKAKLKEQGNLLFNGTEKHNYPMCWRSDTPLMYRAIPTWFIKVEEIRDRLIKNNNQTYWVPSFVKEKRFHNWLAEARDWNVSRTRYWGTPLPIWVSEDFEEMVCIGSVAELEQYAGRKLTDIHRHFIDDITIPSKKGKGVLKRVDEVFDCWFESGSMPYASKHYPFENKDEFEKSFPAQFIAEGLDQTRGWFYTLMVLSTIVFDKPAFQNLIVNGLVLAEDGKKMSKRLKNYPDPIFMCDNYGADAVRMYMCSSPVVRAEPLKFSKDRVKDVVKDVFLPWYHSYRFLVTEATRYENELNTTFVPDATRIKKSSNLMDKWINASTHELIKAVKEEMDAYRLYTVMDKLNLLLEDLTNVYVRLNRDRMKGAMDGSGGNEDRYTSLCALYETLLNVTVMIAPVTPFITELIYRNLSKALPDGHAMKQKSVHFVMVPEYDPEALDEGIQTAVKRLKAVVEVGRLCREQRKVGQKRPLKRMTIYNRDEKFLQDIKTLEEYLKEEINVIEVVYETKPPQEKLSALLNFKALGKKLGKELKTVMEAAKTIPQEDLAKFDETGSITICGHVISGEEMTLTRSIAGLDDPNLHTNRDDGTNTMVVLDFTPDHDLDLMYTCREISNRVNRARKEAKLHPDDPVDMWVEVVNPKKDSSLKEALKCKVAYLEQLLRRKIWSSELLNGHEVKTFEKVEDIEDEKLKIIFTPRTCFFNADALKTLSGGDASAELGIRQYVQTFAYDILLATCKNGPMEITISNKKYCVEHKKHYAVGPADAPWLGNAGGYA